ncbi:MAG: thioredoxin family protein, partial [Planctomycetales bacterium]|nr:thioredoxin family protein [Planctomycetales bacterium]
TPVFAQGIQWRASVDAARQEAAQAKKLVLLHFWGPTCGPCVALERTVFNQPAVAGAIEQQYVPVKIDASEAPALAQAYGITKLPTDVILTADNQVVRRMVSPGTPMDYVSTMQQVAHTYAQNAGSAYQAAANQAPVASPFASQVTNNAYANLTIPPVAPPSAPSEKAQPQVAQQPVQVSNPHVPSQTAPPSQPTGAVAQNQTKPAAPTQAELPAGSPLIGFEGYCTVSMKRDFKWVPGDVRWGAIHRDRTYVFAGQKERDEFLKDPDAYSPVLSGLDPVAVVEENKAVAGKREFAVQYPPHTGQFYMFSTAENLRKFTTNAAGFAEGVRQAMSGTGTTLR